MMVMNSIYNICLMAKILAMVQSMPDLEILDGSNLHYNNLHMLHPNPKPYQITYSDGTKSPWMKVQVRGGGPTSNEKVVYEETLDGFTVQPLTMTNIFDEGNKNQRTSNKYVYVDVNNSTGNWIPTDLVVGIDDPYPSHVSKHAANRRYSILQKRRSNEEDKQQLLKENQFEPESRNSIKDGTLTNLVVAFRFSDHKDRVLPSVDDLDILFNHDGPHETLCPTGSVRDVYHESSYNKIDIVSNVIGWVDINYTEAFCANRESGVDKQFFICLHDALDQVANLGFDFSDFDKNNDGFVDAMTFIHSGYAAEFGGIDAYGNHLLNRIWAHQWSMWTGKWTKDGVSVYRYTASSALWNIYGSEIARIGVISHEVGHFLGLPDLYDYGPGEGIGRFGLMANSWGFDSEQFYPSPMSPWSKYKLGWVEPTIADQPGTYSLRQACDYPDAVLIERGFPRTREYLLIENRQSCGYDIGIPAGGLAIYHIDDFANNVNGWPSQDGWPGNKNHYRVALLQADGEYDLERGNNKGDRFDLFRAGHVEYIGPDGTTFSSYPNTNSYRNGKVRETGITISNIGIAGSLMTFDIEFANDLHTVSPIALPVPTESPIRSPTGSPTEFQVSPTVSPIVSPTILPTVSPTVSPTILPKVVTQSPSLSPTVFPTPSPLRSSNITEPPASLSPMKTPVEIPSFDSLCEDSPLRLKFEENGRKVSRSCDWVMRRDRKSRCNIPGITETCAKTCEACNDLKDSPLRVRFVYNDAYYARSCDWVGRREIRKRCSIPGMNTTCRLTCSRFL